jgi:hypothetical protein
MLFGQQISRVEYFVNTDPGFGLATNATLPIGDSILFPINLTDLPNGINTLYIRILDSNGKWSQTQSRPFIKQIPHIENVSEITKVEYFIDTDPGLGKGIELNGFIDDSMSFTVDLSELDEGIHTLYIRTMDDSGKWSQTQSRLFINYQMPLNDLPNIVYVEYFIDMIGNFGEGTPVEIYNPSSTMAIEVLVDLTHVPLGEHTFYVRAKDRNGIWGMTQSIDFLVCPYIQNNLDHSICEGESYTYNEVEYFETGVYNHTFQTAIGCDSLVVLNLKVNPSYYEEISASICEGDTYTLNGIDYTTEGTYSQNLQTLFGCDSIITLNLSVNPIFNEQHFASICQGETYLFNGIDYKVTGKYEHRFETVFGCDSIVTLNLIVSPIYNAALNASICQGDSYTFDTQLLTTSGVYSNVFTSSLGCDSTVVLTLSVNPVYNDTLSATICQGENYAFGSQTLTETGIYIETLNSIQDCDSTIVLELTVIEVDTSVTINGFTLIANANNATYQWGDCTSEFKPIEGSNNQNFTPDATGLYAVEITQNGCKALSKCFSVNMVGTEEIKQISSMLIFPNPNNGTFIIELQFPLGVIINNQLGIVVYSRFLTIGKHFINLGHLPNGIYILKAYGSREAIVTHICINH